MSVTALKLAAMTDHEGGMPPVRPLPVKSIEARLTSALQLEGRGPEKPPNLQGGGKRGGGKHMSVWGRGGTDGGAEGGEGDKRGGNQVVSRQLGRAGEGQPA